MKLKKGVKENKSVKYFIKSFLRGLLAVVPFLLSFYALVWFFAKVESFAGSIIKSIIGDTIYFTGLGLIAGVVGITFIGIAMTSLIAQKAHAFLEKIIAKLPVLKTIYFAINDFMEFFANPDAKEGGAKKVVLVTLPGQEAKLIGILTNEGPQSIISNLGEEKIAVYLPMSYQIGGFTVFIPKEKITETDLGVEEAMKLAMTAWVTKGTKS